MTIWLVEIWYEDRPGTVLAACGREQTALDAAAAYRKSEGGTWNPPTETTPLCSGRYRWDGPEKVTLDVYPMEVLA